MSKIFANKMQCRTNLATSVEVVLDHLEEGRVFCIGDVGQTLGNLQTFITTSNTYKKIQQM